MRRSHRGRTIVGLAFDIACLSRVECPSLDPQKKWYAYPSYSRTKSEMSQRGKFSLQHQRAYKNYTRLPTNLYVVSTFWYLCLTLAAERGSVRWPSEVSCFSVHYPLVNAIDLQPREAKAADLGVKPS